MTGRETKEKLRKLAAIEARKADLSWLFYLSGEGDERQAADELTCNSISHFLKVIYFQLGI